MNRQQGFSLIEALITLAILGVGLAGAAKLQSLVFSHMLESRAQSEALQFTMEQIERVRFQTRYGIDRLEMPIRRTLAGSNIIYELNAVETTRESGAVRQLQLTTEWEIPGTSGNLSVDTLFTEQPYKQYLYRLSNR